MTQGRTFIEQRENSELLRPKKDSGIGAIFKTSGSTGANSVKLARLVSTFDFVMNVLGWDNKLENDKKEIVSMPVLLTDIIVANQASIDARYHDDYKAIAIAEEIDRKRQDRRDRDNSVSLTSG